MTQDEKRLRCLKRRMEFLAVRTSHGKNKNLSYDCEEFMALKWAVFKLAPAEIPKRPIRSEDFL